MPNELPKITANLASLNEIMAEMVAAVSTDPDFVVMTRDVLRDHSWSLGFEFQGQGPPGLPVNFRKTENT